MEEGFTITIAKSERDFSEAKVLFLEYAAELGVDLCFQDFDKELRELDIQYNPPGGVLLLLKHNGMNTGCAGLRKLDEKTGEMKRMYIKKEFRGKGLSRRLIHELIRHAGNMKYAALRLDTLPQMKEAIGLYLSEGFREILPYRENPVAGAKYMELVL